MQVYVRLGIRLLYKVCPAFTFGLRGAYIDPCFRAREARWRVQEVDLISAHYDEVCADY